MTRKNPPKRYGGETENGRESSCKNGRHQRHNIDTVDAELEQQDATRKSRGERRTLGGFRG